MLVLKSKSKSVSGIQKRKGKQVALRLCCLSPPNSVDQAAETGWSSVCVAGLGLSQRSQFRMCRGRRDDGVTPGFKMGMQGFDAQD